MVQSLTILQQTQFYIPPMCSITKLRSAYNFSGFIVKLFSDVRMTSCHTKSFVVTRSYSDTVLPPEKCAISGSSIFYLQLLGMIIIWVILFFLYILTLFYLGGRNEAPDNFDSNLKAMSSNAFGPWFANEIAILRNM